MVEQRVQRRLFFFLIDKHQNILEKAKKPHVYRGYTQTPKKKN